MIDKELLEAQLSELPLYIYAYLDPKGSTVLLRKDYFLRQYIVPVVIKCYCQFQI